MTIQIESAGGAFRSCAMVGRATLAMAPSSTVMAIASQIVAAAQLRCGCGSPSGWLSIGGGEAEAC